MMDWLADVLVGPGAAGITGLFGGAVAKYFDARVKREELRHAETMRKFDIEEAKIEREHELAIADKQIERAKVEGSIEVEKGELHAFSISQAEGNRSEGILRFVRPGITAYLLCAVSALFVVVWKAVGGLAAFTPTELTSLLQDMVYAALYLAVMCVGWWFGSRGGNVTRRN